ncbi:MULTISPECIES: glycosyltransferase [Sphingomonas]|uniref:glycosyltransferase n=1 Tax=Sphingomonas TaxID=13687 RepID=UPI000DEEBA5A|nr:MULTISPECIES: glycosyltransferase [Sphingomonas]
MNYESVASFSPVSNHSGIEKLDLIVPVYRNKALVQECLDSIRAHIGEISSYAPRLIVVNDSPDDDEVSAYLSTEANHGSIDLLIENVVNFGFVKSVNKALKASKERGASAILINSDTQTFPGTLSELAAVAALDEQFGFVCPRSNNASLCTFPLPPHSQAGLSIGPEASHQVWSELQDLLPRYSLVPTAIGFYMLIRSVVIQNFGGLDERFGVGYEEENDLVMRAGKVGFRAVLANHAFAYHAGSASFVLTDIELDSHRADNLREITRLHPEFLPLVRKFEHSPGFRAESLMKGLLPDSHGRLDIVFNLLSMGRHHNGTNEFIVSALRAFSREADDRFNVVLLCDWDTARFHGLETIPNIRITSRTDEVYAISFSFGQPYDLHDVNVMEKLAPIVVYSMLDVISLDCGPLRHNQKIEDLWDHVADTASGLVFISEFSRKTFVNRFPSVKGRLFAKLLATQRGCYADQYAESRKGARHIFVAGNHFDHKDSTRVGKLLAETFQSLGFVVLGAQESYPPNVRLLRSGAISELEMNHALASSSVVVLPSFYEGFGFTLMHALALGKPIVARDIAATREILQTFGDTSGVVLFGNDDDLPEAVRKALRAGASSVRGEHGPSWTEWAQDLVVFLGQLTNARDEIYKTVEKRLKTGDLLRAQGMLSVLQSQAAHSSVEPQKQGTSGTSVFKWSDLRELPPELFVRKAYEVVLGRSPDPDGEQHHLRLLREGERRNKVVTGLLASSEYLNGNRKVEISGLPRAPRPNRKLLDFLRR